MVVKRVLLATMVGAVAVTAALAMPAIGAPDAARRAAPRAGSTSFFTPASADPKLAALIARSGLGAAPFRFTPADSRDGQRRVAGNAPVAAPKAVVTLRGAPSALPMGVVAPFAYDLGTVAPKRPAINGDIKFDLASGAARKPMDVGATLGGRRQGSKFRTSTERPSDANARLANDVPNYSIDVGGSYSLNRNIDVTAGVRYKAQDRERLSRLTEDARRDSQSVYVGTALRF